MAIRGCGAVLHRFFADDEMVPRLDLNLVDLHSPRSMAAWTMSGLRLDPACLAGGLWPDGDEPVPLTDVLSCAPGTPVDELPGDRCLAVCEALADFADLKSARRGSHSHRVASLAARAASGLGLPGAEQERLRRAGLVHDLGKIAVPHRLLEQAGDDTRAASRRGGAAALAEPVRLHPY